MTKLNKVAVNFPRFDGSDYDPYKMRVLVEELERLVAAYQSSANEDGWDDVFADLSASIVSGANTPTFSTFRDGISAYAFSASVTNEIWVNLQMPHSYHEGVLVYPNIHWAPNTTSTGTVRWGVEYTVQKGHDQGAFPASTTVYIETAIGSNKQYQHLISEVSAGNAFDALEADSLILMRVFRDGAHANDTFPDTVFGFTAGIHFQGNKQFTTFKAPPFHNPR